METVPAAVPTTVVTQAAEDMAAMEAGGAIPAPTAAAVTAIHLYLQIPVRQELVEPPLLLVTVAELSGSMCMTR